MSAGKHDFKKLPVASFITGLLSLSALSFFKISELISPFFKTIRQNIIFNVTLGSILGICLPLAAVICGGIYLRRYKKELHRSKIFKALAIAGIVLGSIILFIVFLLLMGDLLLSDR